MMVKLTDQVSISSTFYAQLLRQYPCAEKLQSQTASTKNFRRKIIGAKTARKMMLKLTDLRRILESAVEEAMRHNGFEESDRRQHLLLRFRR